MSKRKLNIYIYYDIRAYIPYAYISLDTRILYNNIKIKIIDWLKI